MGVLQHQTIMAIHWGLPAHDGDPQFFGSTGGIKLSTMYSIQYGCIGHQKFSWFYWSLWPKAAIVLSM
jgi:hypothetical protein